MKKLMKVSAMSFAFLAMVGVSAMAQDSNVDAEVPGDNFSLEGALELFKKSASPEEFERLLNSEDNKVNNLDLNGDGEIDYIKVIDRNEGNVHAFVLQAVVSPSESQDVAVIELETLGNGKAVLQIVGDSDIYGIETIIEPTEEVRVNAGASTARTTVNVWAWPSVQYVYSPYYSPWYSPWAWSSYPGWWRPWRPVYYSVYRPYWNPYRSYYSVCHVHRISYAHNMYRPYRTTSVIVYDRHRSQVSHYRSSRGADQYGRQSSNRNGHESHNSRSTESRRTADNGRYSSDRSDNGRTREYSNSNDRSSRRSSDVQESTPSREWSAPQSRERSSSVERREPSVKPERTNPTSRTHSSGQVRESSHRSPVVRPSHSGGQQRSSGSVQRSGGSRSSQPASKPSRSGGSGGGSGGGKRGRN